MVPYILTSLSVDTLVMTVLDSNAADDDEDDSDPGQREGGNQQRNTASGKKR